MNTKPVLKSIDFGATVSAIQEFAGERNIPTKQYPAEEGKGVPVAVPAPAPVAKAVARASTRKLTLELPAYVIDALNIRAATGKTTSKHLVMLGLRATGIAIKDEDMTPDGRRSSV
jgi:hypothetical protein